MKTQTKFLNGREIDYKDVIHSHITTRFSFWDRVKILLGKNVRTHLQVYTGHDEALVVGSEAHTTVDRIITRKSRGMMHSPPQERQDGFDNSGNTERVTKPDSPHV